jgi:hypothetical protein
VRTVAEQLKRPLLLFEAKGGNHYEIRGTVEKVKEYFGAERLSGWGKTNQGR